MKVDRPRLLRAVILAAWAAFFLWLWLSGEVTRYLGPRTQWVVVFGSITLGLAALAHLVTIRSETQGRNFSWRELGGVVILVVPIASIILIPQAELGALAVSRKSSGGLAAAVSSAAPDPEFSAQISFIDIHYASQTQEYADIAGITEGREVDLVGFVSKNHADGSFDLTRFYVSCCAADAVPYTVRVLSSETGGGHDLDQWLRVSGALSRFADAFAIAPEAVEEREAPRNPYLY